MENPLFQNSPEENVNPENVPNIDLSGNTSEEAPQEAASAVAPVVAKKPFFTTGKIISIIAGLVIVGTVVGAVIYSQNAERFQGAVYTVTGIQLAPVKVEAPLATAPTTTTTTTTTTPTPDLTHVDTPTTTTTTDTTTTDTTTTTTNVTTGFGLTDKTTETPLVSFNPNVTPLKPDVTLISQPTCESAAKDLIDAYNAKNWTNYKTALESLESLKCLDTCKSKIYWVIYYLNVNDVGSAQKSLDAFQASCAKDCNSGLAMVAVIADILSQIDLKAQQTVTHVVPGLTDAHRNLLRDAVEFYIKNCTCEKIESLIQNFTSPLTSYFPSSVSTGSYSPAVLSILQQAVKDLCIPPPVKEEPKTCKSLVIKKPTELSTYTISSDLNPATDVLEIVVDVDSNIQNYSYKSANGKVTMDGQASLTTASKSVKLSGSPDPGSSDTITVTAIDVTGLALKECTDTIVIERTKPPVTQDEPKVCRSLEIIVPIEAKGAGNVTYTIDKNGFLNEPLKILIDADAGSYGDLRFSSVDGNITFDGQGTLDTTVTEVLMNGGPAEGQEETVTVWARDPKTQQGISTCHDSFTVKVPEPPTDDTPPPTITYVPPTEETPPPVVTETPPPVTEIPPPVVVTTVPAQPPVVQTPVTPISQPTHAAAPVTPKTGPGLLIPLFGAALGGAILRRKKK